MTTRMKDSGMIQEKSERLLKHQEMYKKIIRPILFRFPPEGIHAIIMILMRCAHYIPGARCILKAIYTVKSPLLEREVFGIRFPNPVGLAAGFDKNADVYSEIAAFGFGFVEIGTVTPLPQPGNPKPRLFRLPKDNALINRMGFNNNGMDAAVRNLRRRSRLCPRKRPVVGGNLGKNTVTLNEKAPADYLKLFRSLYEYVDYFVINVSCPNVAGMTKLQNKEDIYDILTPLFEFRRGQNDYRPLLLKISPDLTTDQVDGMIEILVDTDLDGIVATNTTRSREGLKTSKQELDRIGDGGLSGAPLTKRAIEMVRYIHQKTEGRFPIIGVGGIMSEDDAVEMLNAGASLIEVYTGFIYEGPMFAKRICRQLIEEAKKPQ